MVLILEANNACLTGYFFILDWILVQEKSECEGVGSDKGNSFETVEECAVACYKESSMFAFDQTGGCWCETGANFEGTCSMKDAPSLNLYRYRYRGENFFWY